MRIGMGYDVHKLVEERELILGGVKIPYEKGLLGHSDADVLLHAIMDALLGAAALGDIGKHFPDTDPAYKGISSMKLLEHVGRLINDKLYVVGNIDATIIAQRPKMAPHIEQMRRNIAQALRIEVSQINVKATTEEGLGFTGSGEGISAQAVACLETVANYSYVAAADEEERLRRLREMSGECVRKIQKGGRMEIQRLEQEEKKYTRSLYEEVFSEDSKAFVDYYYTEKTKDNVIYAAKEDGQIRGMLHLNPYMLSVNDSERKVNYIVAVATQKAYRRRGYMGALLKCALKDMYEEGQSFTFLMPAAESIYLPHDFRTVYEQEKSYYVEGEREYPMVPATEADCPALAEMANRYLGSNYQVFAKRDTAYYERLIKEYASDGGSLMIRRKDGEIADFKIFLPDGGEKEKPKIMVRIVDVRRMLMSVRVKSLIAVCFSITDPVIEENNRCVVLTGTEFSGAMLMDSKPENSEGTVTVAALTSFLFGAKTAEEICQEEGVSMSERMKGEFEKIIPLSRIYLNEVV